MSGANTGYLGGDVSMAERYALRDRYIAPLEAKDLGLHNQCRCGGTTYAKWRGRFYCKRCARWIKTPRAALDASGEKK